MEIGKYYEQVFLSLHQIFSWTLSEDLKSFGESFQHGDVKTITLGINFKWKELLEGMKPNASRLIFLRSLQLGSELGNYPSNTNIAIKFDLVQKLYPTVKEEVTKKEEKVPKKEEKVTKKEEKVPKKEEKVTKKEEKVTKLSQVQDEVLKNAEKVESKSRLDKHVARVGQPVMMMPSSENQIKKMSQVTVNGSSGHTTGTNPIILFTP